MTWAIVSVPSYGGGMLAADAVGSALGAPSASALAAPFALALAEGAASAALLAGPLALGDDDAPVGVASPHPGSRHTNEIRAAALDACMRRT